MKKTIAFFLVIVLLVTFSPLPAYALEENLQCDGFLEPERITAIERLYNERAKLALNLTDNVDEIVRIDYQLETLGVEEISEKEVFDKVNSQKSARATVPTNDKYTKWTSNRAIYVYQGIQYELQIIKAVANADSSSGTSNLKGYPLIGTSTAAIKAEYGVEAAKTAAVTFLMKKIGETVVEGFADELESVPVGGAAIKWTRRLVDVGMTIEETENEVTQAMKADALLENVEYTCTVSMVSTEEYIFAKISGVPDEGNQILAYVGNQTQCKVILAGAGQTVIKIVMEAMSLFRLFFMTFSTVWLPQKITTVGMNLQ